jgi:23S rRNA (adenine2030-N6)-methyltransferase
MNYRHAFHAGNHADVLKHAVFARVIEHMKKKDKGFRIVDAHAGTGLYSLSSPEASRTQEWQQGVGRFFDIAGRVLPLGPDAEPFLQPWRSVVRAVNGGGGSLTRYPGSPEIAAQLMRAQDRLYANELHPEDHALLARHFAADRRVTVTELDASQALKAALPPVERRGVVLIDPPYEKSNEAELAVRMLREGLKRFATGCFLIWYPVTGDGLSDHLTDAVMLMGLPKLLKAELLVRKPVREGGLAGSGLLIVNPPWLIDLDLSHMLPALTERMAQGKGAGSTLVWLAGGEEPAA